jgi:hypothetical protein
MATISDSVRFAIVVRSAAGELEALGKVAKGVPWPAKGRLAVRIV